VKLTPCQRSPASQQTVIVSSPSARIDSAYFAEGLTDWHGLLVQLTWQSHLGFVYDMATLIAENVHVLT